MHWLIALSLISFSAFAKVNNDCLARVRGETTLEKRLAENDFKRERGFQIYSNLLQARNIPSLTDFLKSLKNGQVYLDAGAGNAIAVREILEKFKRLRAVAAAYKKPESQSLEEDLHALQDRFTYADGGFIENMVENPNSALFPWRGKVMFLTDVFGPSVYTRDLNALLNAYADLLAPGGQALIHFYEEATDLQIRGLNGRDSRATLRELRALIPVVTGGRLQVREARMQLEGQWPRFETSIFWIEKVSEVSVDPRDVFELTEIKDGGPALRWFRVNPPKGFVFDRDASRAADMEREKTRFQKAYVPLAFEFKD